MANTNEVQIIQQNKWYRLWIDPKNFNPRDPLSFKNGFRFYITIVIDDDTIVKDNDGKICVGDQAFQITEDTVKFADGATLSFKDFWQSVLNKINGLITAVDENKDKTFVFEQATTSDTWEIEHNLGKFPAVSVVDSAGSAVVCQCNYVNENKVILRMNGAFKGKAFLN